MDSKWWKMAIFVTYWILLTSFLVTLIVVIVLTMHHCIKGVIICIRWTIDQRNRDVRVVDASQFEN